MKSAFTKFFPFFVLTAQKMVESQETGRMGDSVMAVNGIHVAKSKTLGHVRRNHPLQLTYDGGIRETKEQDTLQGTTSSPSHLQSRGSVSQLLKLFAKIILPFVLYPL